MSSYSTSDGSMSLTITFKLGTNLDQANVLVQNRVAVGDCRACRTRCAALGVTTRKSSPDLMMVVHMLSPDDSYDQLYISNYASIRIRDQLLRLDGVGDIQLFGAREYSLRVWLDPNRLAAYQLTAADVVRCPAGAERPGLGRRARPAAGADGCRLPAHRADARPLRGRAPVPAGDRQVRRRRAPRARRRRGAGRARRARLRHELVPERQAGRGARHLPAPGHQCARPPRRASSRR